MTCLGIFLLPVATLVMFGKMLKNLRHAAVIFGVMLVLSVTTHRLGHVTDTIATNPALTAKTGLVYPLDVPQADGTVKPVLGDRPAGRPPT